MGALGHAWHGRRATRHVEATAPAQPIQAHRQLAVLGLAVLAAAAVVAWLLLDQRRNEQPAPSASDPTLVAPAELARAAGRLSRPLYWAGARAGYAYELTVTANGRAFVRYLPQGLSPGDPRAAFLTVATYPDADGFANLERAARRDDAKSMRLAPGGIAVVSAKAPSSVYLGYPDARYQVEVFDPSGRARQLVASGVVSPAR